MTTYRAIYNDSEGLQIIIPAYDKDPLAVRLIAEKDVPSGTLFKIVETSTLPTDRTYRNAWTAHIDEMNADGVGLTKEQFVEKYPELEGWAVQ